MSTFGGQVVPFPPLSIKGNQRPLKKWLILDRGQGKYKAIPKILCQKSRKMSKFDVVMLKNLRTNLKKFSLTKFVTI